MYHYFFQAHEHTEKKCKKIKIFTQTQIELLIPTGTGVINRIYFQQQKHKKIALKLT